MEGDGERGSETGSGTWDVVAGIGTWVVKGVVGRGSG